MKKINLEVEAVVYLPVKVKLDMLIRADEDADIDLALRQIAKGRANHRKWNLEDVQVESAGFHGLLDDDDNAPLADQVTEYLKSSPKLEVLSSKVTDAR